VLNGINLAVEMIFRIGNASGAHMGDPSRDDDEKKEKGCDSLF
jgi:hypothetical protein